MDLNATFDTVDHDILFERLPPTRKLGLQDTALDWFHSYQSDRCQQISVCGSLAEKFHLRYGDSLGSCHRALLFKFYASSLFDILRNHLPTVHCYADDTQLYKSFSPDEYFGQAETVGAVENCVEAIQNWMSEDQLLMNDSKTEFLLISLVLSQHSPSSDWKC